jgi:hypothetical protein
MSPYEATPPGWYTDPWYPGAVRYWDGATWTSYAQSVAAPRPAEPLDLPEETRWARRARMALWVQAACGAVLSIVGPIAFNSLWRSFTDSIGDDAGPSIGAGFLLGSGVMQLAGLVSLAATAVIAMWCYRSTINTHALGRPTTHAPVWAVASWFVPIVSYWFPYQVMRDLVPDGHPVRSKVGVWWGLHLGTGLLAGFALVAAFASVAVGLAIGLVIVAGYVWRAVLGSSIVSSVADEHAAGAATAPV